MKLEHVLALDIAGNPFKWLTPEEAVTLYVKDKVAWDLGSTKRVFRGGFSHSGEQSRVTIKPIVAVQGSEKMASLAYRTPQLGDRDNALLFRRDRNTCAYCAQVFDRRYLTRNVHARGPSCQIGFGDNARYVMDDATQLAKIAGQARIGRNPTTLEEPATHRVRGERVISFAALN